jgi:hypothetical protein
MFNLGLNFERQSREFGHHSPLRTPRCKGYEEGV